MWNNPGIKGWILTLQCLISLIDLVQCKRYSIYDPFCKEEILFEPYIKFYHGRLEAVKTGMHYKQGGPGFYRFNLTKNASPNYVCVNGMAWLYFKLSKHVPNKKTQVYENSELHSFIHHCFLVNGKEGPGKHDSKKKLLSILLVGSPSDYRLPSIQLFTAPYQDPGKPEILPGRGLIARNATPPSTPYNAVSLFQIGSHSECILEKGKVQFRLRTEIPTRTNDTISFCKLSYQHITVDPAESNIGRPPDQTTFETGTNLELSVRTVTELNTTIINVHGPGGANFDLLRLRNEAKGLLRNDEKVRAHGCWAPDNYTDLTLETIKYRIDLVVNITVGSVYQSVFNVSSYFSKKIKPTVDRVGTTDATNLDYWPDASNVCAVDYSDCEPSAVKLAVDGAVATALSTAVTPTEDEIRNLTIHEGLKFKLRLCRDEAHKARLAVEATRTLALGQWAVAYTAIKSIQDDLAVYQIAYDIAKSTYDHLSALEREGIAAKNDLQQAKINFETGLISIRYLARMDEASAFVSVAEMYSKRLDYLIEHQVREYYDKLIDQYKKGVRGGEVDCGGCCDNQKELGYIFPPVKVGVVVIKRDSGRPVELVKSVLVPPPPPETMFENEPGKTCGVLPKMKDACANAKPEKKRACQLLRARMGEVNIVGVEIKPVGKRRRKRQVDDSALEMPSWRMKVLDTVASIYNNVSYPMLKRGFTESILDVAKAYLVDYVEGTLPKADRVQSPKITTCTALTCEDSVACKPVGNRCISNVNCSDPVCETTPGSPTPCKWDNKNITNPICNDNSTGTKCLTVTCANGCEKNMEENSCLPPLTACKIKECLDFTDVNKKCGKLEIGTNQLCGDVIVDTCAAIPWTCKPGRVECISTAGCLNKPDCGGLSDATKCKWDNSDPNVCKETGTDHEVCIKIVLPTCDEGCEYRNGTGCVKSKCSVDKWKLSSVGVGCGDPVCGIAEVVPPDTKPVPPSNCVWKKDPAASKCDNSVKPPPPATPPPTTPVTLTCPAPKKGEDCDKKLCTYDDAGTKCVEKPMACGQPLCKTGCAWLGTGETPGCMTNETTPAACDDKGEGSRCTVSECRLDATGKICAKPEYDCGDPVCKDLGCSWDYKAKECKDGTGAKCPTVPLDCTREGCEFKTDKCTFDCLVPVCPTDRKSDCKWDTDGCKSGGAACGFPLDKSKCDNHACIYNELVNKCEPVKAVKGKKKRRKKRSTIIDFVPDEYRHGPVHSRAKRSAELYEPLKTKGPLWDDVIIPALVECDNRGIGNQLYFKRKKDAPRDTLGYSLWKRVRNGSRVIYVDTDFELMLEQADLTYDFNYVVDNLWRMFVTILGRCMTAYEKKIPFITVSFYTHFTQDFFVPLSREWVNNRDNAAFKYLYGEWYNSEWPRIILEGSFVQSGDVNYRPPRRLYVNDLNEANFFVEGPLAGKMGMYAAV